MIRQILRTVFWNKSFFIINVTGLSVGLAAALLIFQFVRHELAYDRFHTHGDNIYRIRFDAFENNEPLFKSASVFPGVAPLLKSDFPEVKEATRLFLRHGGGVVSVGDIAFKETNVFQAEQSFFSVFSYPLLSGKARLDEPNTALIESNTAVKYFGQENPIGKRIKFGNDEAYEITGVIESSAKSHLKFSFIFSYPTLVTMWGKDFNSSWGWYDFYTYVLLHPLADPADLEAKFPEFINKYGNRKNESAYTKFSLQPLKDIHLYSNLVQEAEVNGDGDSVYFMLAVGIVIIILAWANYLNLSTAIALYRAKEIAVRKVSGAGKQHLARQFILESFSVNFIAVLGAILLVYIAIPYMVRISGIPLSAASIFYDGFFWFTALLFLVAGTIVSAIYPSTIMASYHPAVILRGFSQTSAGGIAFRKALITGQFVSSAILISAALVVHFQLGYTRSKDLGVSISNVLVVHAPGILPSDSVFVGNVAKLKDALAPHPEIENITLTTEVPGNPIFWAMPAKRRGDDDQRKNQMYILGVDYEFFRAYEIRFLSGRGYGREFTDTHSSIVLNKKAVEVFNLQSPENAIGQTIEFGDSGTRTIVGVIDNYHHEGLKQDFRPTAYVLIENPRNYVSLKLRADASYEKVLGFTKEHYEQLFPNNPFDYFFLKDFFNHQYKADRQLSELFIIFAVLANFIAGLGLFGVATFTIGKRRKEIAVRKVLGSSARENFYVLSKDFAKLAMIANLISVPLGWFWMREWLNTFTFHIPIPYVVFVLSPLVCLAVVFATVSYTCVKEITRNPTLSLRNE